MSLTQPQEIVLNALAEGATTNEAAAFAQVHRNTITNWKRSSPDFRNALNQAQYERVLTFRAEAEERLHLALATIDDILNDPTASPSVRLRAALAILKQVSLPLPAPPPVIELPTPQSQTEPTTAAQSAQSAQFAQSAQPAPTAEAAQPTSEAPAEAAQFAQSAQYKLRRGAQPAQTPFRRNLPKVGRNDDCPCGSKLKFKRCCLNKPAQSAQFAQSA